MAGKRARAERGAANTRRRRKGPPLAQRGVCPSAGNRTAPTWKPLPAWAPRSSHQRSTLRVMLQTGSHTRHVAEGPTATSESVLKTRGTSGVLVVTKCRGPFSSSSPLLPPSLSLLNARLVPPPSSWTLHILRCLSSSWPLTADRPGPSAHTSSLSSDVPKSALASTRGQHRFHFGFCLWKAEESDTYILPFLASLGSGTAWSRKLHLISVTSLTRPGETR